MHVKFSVVAIALVMLSMLASCSTKSKAPIPYEMSTFKDENAHAVIDIEYPVFSNMDKLNAAIEQAVFNTVFDEFRQTSEANWLSFNEGQKESGALETVPPFSYKVNCDYVFNGPLYISVLFTTYVYEGGAHGSTLLDTVTYDIAAKKVMSIDDVPNLSLIEIATKCNEILFQTLQHEDDDEETREAIKDWIAEGTAPEVYNYSAFTFDGTELTVYFEPYAVAPYSAGIQKVTLPVK